MVAGAPALPNVCRSLIIPDDAEMAVKVLASSYYDITDIARESVQQAERDIAKFEKMAGSMLDDFDSGDIGHNFWLTRNHHGTGFWDGDYEPYGDELTDIAHKFGESDPYVGSDGLN